MKYRKKPVVIEAIQWTGLNLKEISNFINSEDFWHKDSGLFIKTLEGNMKANANDWIIKWVQGEFYPCKPDIFEQTYDKVDNSTKE